MSRALWEQPLVHDWCLVGGEAVADHVDRQAGIGGSGRSHHQRAREADSRLRPPTITRSMLVQRVSTVHGLAVVPAYRHQGIARALLQAEETSQEAGSLSLALRHERRLTDFYGRFGYTSHNRFSLPLPTGELLSLVEPSAGCPLTGALSDCHAYRACSAGDPPLVVSGSLSWRFRRVRYAAGHRSVLFRTTASALRCSRPAFVWELFNRLRGFTNSHTYTHAHMHTEAFMQ
ncbi:GNAT family N-acetyltransferase [Streptomyces sp. NPDC056004]|uniref:GNAT family N-acetyltransferase n=1 Tax=Streptomyces sp. NPDC056004 TaxID=3345677 RepID=UPI0035E21DF5